MKEKEKYKNLKIVLIDDDPSMGVVKAFYSQLSVFKEQKKWQ